LHFFGSTVLHGRFGARHRRAFFVSRIDAAGEAIASAAIVPPLFLKEHWKWMRSNEM
jgi:hypothetical protein